MPVTKPPAADGNAGGFGGGVSFGYDAALTDQILVGIVGNVTVGDWRYNYDFGERLVGYYDQDVRLSLRGRAGVVVAPGLLVYGTAGFERVELEHGGTDTPPTEPMPMGGGAGLGGHGPQTISFSTDGWVAGGGAEVNIGGATVFGEYLRSEFDAVEFVLHGENHRFEHEHDTLRGGVKIRLSE